MADEMERLRQANPFSPERAAAILGIDQRVATRRDPDHGWYLDQDQPAAHDSVERQRSKKARGGTLAAAAVVLALLGFAITARLDNGGLIEASVAAPAGDAETLVLQSGGPGFERATDLLVVHLDFADSVDIHAAVAAREVADWFNLEPVVVAGTQSQGTGRSAGDLTEAMDVAWDGQWLDAQSDWAGALLESRDRWLVTLDAGGHVWVAEAGASDFTADVVRSVVQRRPDLAVERVILVVQHSDRNEAATQQEDLAYTQSRTAYWRVDSGDQTNGTAKLTGWTERFAEVVGTGPHGERWAAAFAQHPVGELDFSDLVPVLDILGVGTEQVATVDDYTAFFIGDQPDAALRGDS